MPSFDQIYQVISQGMVRWTSRPEDYWKGIYEWLMWYEHKVPHIVEANDLKKHAWAERARQVEMAMATAYQCQANQVSRKIDRLSRKLKLAGRQRNNYTGMGFTALLTYLFKSQSQSQYQFIPEARVGQQVFKGVKDPPRNRIDIVAVDTRHNREYAIISMKWSIRHDRLRDLLDECTFYKNNARLPFYFVITNEYNPGRLNIVRQNQCINGLFHVNKDLLLAVNGGNGRLAGIQDLTEVFHYF